LCPMMQFVNTKRRPPLKLPIPPLPYSYAEICHRQIDIPCPFSSISTLIPQ
jgi:hypothetical protein